MHYLRKELSELRIHFGVFGTELCTPDEQTEFSELVKQGLRLPDGVGYRTAGGFFRYKATPISQEELNELLRFKQ